MVLVERDYVVLRELDRWRFALSRHLRYLGDFSGQRACDRRLKLLIDAGYINRKHVLYGVPGLCFVTHKGKILSGLSPKPDKFKVDQIVHDIAMLDTAVYFILKDGLSLCDIITEKQLHQQDGFGNRQHKPDFVFVKDGKTVCVEIELTPKAKARMEKNLQDNFMTYDRQIWVVPQTQIKILRTLEEQSNNYPNIEVLDLGAVQSFLKSSKESGGS